MRVLTSEDVAPVWEQGDRRLIGLPNAWEVLGPPSFQLRFRPFAEAQALAKELRAQAEAAGKKPKAQAGHRLIMLKNAKKITRAGVGRCPVCKQPKGHPNLSPSPAYRKFERWAIGELAAQVLTKRWLPLGGDLLVSAVYVPPSRVGQADLDGMVATVFDLLQHSKAILNDSHVKRMDWSEIMPPDPLEPKLFAWVVPITLVSPALGEPQRWAVRT